MVESFTRRRVTWRGSKASFLATRTLHGVRRSYKKSIDLGGFGIPKDGLLGEAISSFEPPIDITVANQLSTMLNSMKLDQEAIRIMSTEPKALSKGDLIDLFRRMETAIDLAPGLDKGSLNSIASFWRRPFTRPGLLLGDGTLTDETGFKSSFPSHNSAEGRLRAGQRKAQAIYADVTPNEVDPQDPEASWKASVASVISSLESACWAVIDDYLALREKHRELRSSDSKRAHLNKSDQILAAVLKRINEKKLYLIDSWDGKAVLGWRSLTGRPSHHYLYVSVEPSRLFPKSMRWQQFLLAEYYLPRLVASAAQILVLCRTGWNVTTVAAMERDQVHLSNTFCDLFPTKSKTSDSIHLRIYRSREPRLFDLMKMTVENDAAITRDWRRSDNTLWASWSQAKFSFSTEIHGNAMPTIATRYGTRSLTKKALRDYKNVNDWLSHGDIFQSKEDMDHHSIDTAVAYLNLHVFSVLNEANIAKYMVQLSKSILWIGRKNVPRKQRNQLLDGCDESNLLFPLPSSEAVTSSAACDRWMNAVGKESIRIGAAEIRHLRWQLQYYANYALDLSRDNPLQFTAIHLPRMIFAAALAKVVSESPLGRLLDG